MGYFNAGADRLVRKEDLGEAARVAPPRKPPASMWQPFTARARRAMHLADEEARRLGHDALDTQDLLYRGSPIHHSECAPVAVKASGWGGTRAAEIDVSPLSGQ